MQNTTTNQLLADSFKALVLTEPIEKITIKEITDKAGVIRPTFYNHFQDKYALLEWIIRTELIEPVIPIMKGGFIKEGITIIFSNMEKEKEFYTRAARLEGQNSFASIIQNMIEWTILHYIELKVGENKYFHNWMSSEMLAEYYARSLRFITIKWTLSGMTLPPSELAELCENVFESNLDEIIEQMK